MKKTTYNTNTQFNDEFNKLYLKHKKGVGGILKKIFNCNLTAEDLTHEVFIKIIEKWPRLKIIDTPAEKKYISRMAVNCAKDHLRKSYREQRKKNRVVFNEVSLTSDFFRDVADIYIEGEIMETLYDAIESLKGKEQKIMIEKLICEKKDYHITKSNNISNYALKKIEQKLSERIREQFQDYNPDRELQ